MVFQIYETSQDNSRNILFDIEYYDDNFTRLRTNAGDDERKMFGNKMAITLWRKKIKVSPFVENILLFVRDRMYLLENGGDFIDDCSFISRLDLWLYDKQKDNAYTSEDFNPATKEWLVELKKSLTDFCNKFNLELNID